MDARSGAPQAFEVVKEARALREDVDDEGSVVEQNPVGGAAVAFAAGTHHAQFFEALFDFIADGVNLRMAEARANEEIFGEGTELAEIEESNVLGVFASRGVDGAVELRTQKVSVQR